MKMLKPYNDKTSQEPDQKKKGKFCTATNVKQPNFNVTARSRTVHLTSEKRNLTKCNMRVVETMTEEQMKWTVFENRRCKVCFPR